MKNDTTIAVVDNHLLFAESLAALINGIPGYQVILTAKDGNELKKGLELDGNLPKLVLLDVSPRVADSFETATWLQKNHPDILVMALSANDQDYVIVKMLSLGCRGYLLKDISPIELQKGLDTLVSHGYYVSECVSGKLLNGIQKDNWPDKQRITERELEFLQYVPTEMTYKEIAEAMSLRSKTIDGYRESLFFKLNVKSRVGLAVYAIKNGIVEI